MDEIKTFMNEKAMQIIMFSGDARVTMQEAIEELKRDDMDQFKESLDDANKLIVQAHTAQTQVIQKLIEINDEVYSILFSHAQDTVMTVKSEYEMLTKMGIMYSLLINKIGEEKNE